MNVLKVTIEQIKPRYPRLGISPQKETALGYSSAAVLTHRYF